jgi:hypothetical protein
MATHGVLRFDRANGITLAFDDNRRGRTATWFRTTGCRPATGPLTTTCIAGVVSAVSVAVGVGFAVWEATGHAARRPNGYRQGDCVVVKAHERGGELNDKAVRCDVDRVSP